MVRLLRAPNPSPLTLDGTNGYIVSVAPRALVAIDPGIDDAAHIDAFISLARAEHATYGAILVTHGHPDHYPGALALRARTGAPIFAHSAATFSHDRDLADGDVLAYADATLTAIHAPGHARDHLVFWLAEERALFTGDVVIGTGTVVIAPPSGDMRVYQASLERLLREYGHADVLYGGHGPAVHTPRAKLQEYIAHRALREAQIVAALERAPATIPDLVAQLYAAVNPIVWPAAARQVLAYLIALTAEGRVRSVAMTRPPSARESLLLDPDLKIIAARGDADVARAELGVDRTIESFECFSLVT